MKKTLVLLYCCCLGFCLSGQELWGIDPTNSSIQFQVPHLLISKVTGRFNNFNAGIQTAQADTFDGAKVEAILKVKNIDTGNQQRDHHLLQADFFEEDKHPDISFLNGTIKYLEDNNFQLTGELTIKGISKPVTLTGTFGGFAEMWGQKRAGFSAKGTINRFDFKIQFSDKLDNGGWVVGEEITIIMDLEFVKKG